MKGQHVEIGQPLVKWDPFTSAVLTERGGKVNFKDIVEGEKCARRPSSGVALFAE